MTRTLLVIALLAGCKKTEPEHVAAGSAAPPPPPVVADAASPPDAADAFDPGPLATPESVYYDEGRDMYMVSNINGEAAKADDNGYLTVVNPDGSNERANSSWKWIDGSADDIKLDAPKGMAISGTTLYVADISVVRRFEAKPGKQQDDIAIEGATFLNDVVSDGNGGVYVSDTGVGPDFKPNGGDAVYHVTRDGVVKPLIKNKDLGGPNGLWVDAKGAVWVVTFGSGEIYDVSAKGVKGKSQKLPTGQLDGIVGLDGGDLAVSSWDCKCVYRGKPGGEWKVIAKDVEAPADIGYDPKRKRLIIPGFTTNKLTVVQL